MPDLRFQQLTAATPIATDILPFVKDPLGVPLDRKATFQDIIDLVQNTSFTPGSVIFANALGDLAQDNANFFWDDTNNRLGIGTAAPSYPLDVRRDTGVTLGEHQIATIAGSSAAGLLFGYTADGAARTSGFMRSPSGYDLTLGAGATYADAIFIDKDNGNTAMSRRAVVGASALTGTYNANDGVLEVHTTANSKDSYIVVKSKDGAGAEEDMTLVSFFGTGLNSYNGLVSETRPISAYVGSQLITNTGDALTTFNGVTPFAGILGYDPNSANTTVIGNANIGGNLLNVVVARKQVTDVGAVIGVTDDAGGIGSTVADLTTFDGISLGDDGTPFDSAAGRAIQIFTGDGLGGKRFNADGTTGSLTLFDPVAYTFGTSGLIVSQVPTGAAPRFGFNFQNLNQIASSNGGGSPGTMPMLFENGVGNYITGIFEDTNIATIGIKAYGYDAIAPSGTYIANDFVMAVVDFSAASAPIGPSNSGFYSISEYLTGNGLFVHMDRTGVGSRHITIGDTDITNSGTDLQASQIGLYSQRVIIDRRSDYSNPTLELQNNSVNLTDILGTGSVWNMTTTGILQFGSTAGDPLLTSDGQAAYNNTTDRFRVRANGTIESLAYLSDVTASDSLQEAYTAGGAGGGTITLANSGGAMTFTVPNTINTAALILNQNDTTNNPVAFSLLNTGTGNDITATNWNMTQVGVLNNTGLDITKTADQTALRVTSSAATSHTVDFIKTAGTGRAISSTYSSSANEQANIFTNSGTGANLLLDQNGNGIALDIDSEATTTPQQRISLGQLFTGALTSSAFSLVSSNAGTTGTLFHLEDDSTAGSGSPFVHIRATGGTARTTMNVTSASTSGAVAISSSSGVGLQVTQTGDNYGLHVESSAATANGAYIHYTAGTGSALVVDNDNAGTGLEIQGNAVATPALLFSTSSAFTGADANSSVVFRQTNLTTATGSVLYVSAAIAGSASNPVVKFEATNAVHDQPVLQLTQAGTGTALSATGSILGTSSIQSSGSTGIGYATGAGGAVTQITSKSTGVTLNTITGAITMNAANLANNGLVSFVMTNSTIAATDVIILNHRSAGTGGGYSLNPQPAAGSVTINIKNISGGALAEAIVISFAVIKSVTA